MADVELSGPEDGVSWVRINRPEVKNALNRNARELLAQHFTALSEDANTRCIVLTGGDKVFAAGADIRDLANATTVEVYLRNTQRLWQAIAQCPKPIISAVNGFAFGAGCELAMHTDIIVAGESASFAQPEVKVGIMPGAGGTQRLVRAVGKFHAMKMVMTGEAVSGREALAMGLASECVADADVQSRASELAKTIAAMPPLAIAQIKEVVLTGQDASLEAALALERKAFQILFSSEDQKEGMRAFLEKRKPGYKGR
ncbi:MAG: enoyl-CoA hydratase [Hyphomicrobium sp.]|jgi:enoyl-CoA hydratase/carnithine racemase|nr:enoyl-CoA hydratase [Hyphomicrobium sp.]